MTPCGSWGRVMGDEASGFLAGFSAGSHIAGYRLEEQIGRGGMAVVYRARDERLQRQVALKVLSPALAADEAFRGLDHPDTLAAAEWIDYIQGKSITYRGNRRPVYPAETRTGTVPGRQRRKLSAARVIT